MCVLYSTVQCAIIIRSLFRSNRKKLQIRIITVIRTLISNIITTNHKGVSLNDYWKQRQ